MSQWSLFEKQDSAINACRTEGKSSDKVMAILLLQIRIIIKVVYLISMVYDKSICYPFQWLGLDINYRVHAYIRLFKVRGSQDQLWQMDTL